MKKEEKIKECMTMITLAGHEFCKQKEDCDCELCYYDLLMNGLISIYGVSIYSEGEDLEVNEAYELTEEDVKLIGKIMRGEINEKV